MREFILVENLMNAKLVRKYFPNLVASKGMKEFIQGKKPHEYKICKRTFERMKALKFHEIIHAEKPIDNSTAV